MLIFAGYCAMHMKGEKYFDSYSQVLDFLYKQLPMFQRIGASAFKKDLSNTIKLCEFLGEPQHQFKSVHVGGTNGKGSSSHFLAAILQSAGYNTGLYTSPHLKKFTERIKINGHEISKRYVVDFINKVRPIVDEVQPSFFELTVAMAFDHFASQKVDIAIIEVGMGGRLDSTNLVMPEVSLITNISMDHQQWLGDTLEAIAGEKAGIIKNHIPVVISERQPKISSVFTERASKKSSEISFASDVYSNSVEGNQYIFKRADKVYKFSPQLLGSYQKSNLTGVLNTIELLNERGFTINEKAIKDGVENVVDLTGIKGRWQVLKESPKVICDVGHNEAGVHLIVDQLTKEEYDKLYIVWGTVEDKDIKSILSILPKHAYYYFCQATIPRAMDANELKSEANRAGLKGEVIKDVNTALKVALNTAGDNDLIFAGGSTFVVAELDQL